MCAESWQLKGSMASLGVFFVSVFEQRAHVNAQTTRLAHDLDQISVVLQMWPRIVALTCGLEIYTASNNVSLLFSLFQYSQWRSSPAIFRKTQLHLRRCCLHLLRVRSNPRDLPRTTRLSIIAPLVATR